MSFRGLACPWRLSSFVRWRRSRLEHRLGIRYAPSPCLSQRVRAEEEMQLDSLMRVAPLDPTQLGIEKVGQQPVNKLGCRALGRQNLASRQYSIQNPSRGSSPCHGRFEGCGRSASPSACVDGAVRDRKSVRWMSISRPARANGTTRKNRRERSKVDRRSQTPRLRRCFPRQSDDTGESVQPPRRYALRRPGLKRVQRSCRAVQL